MNRPMFIAAITGLLAGSLLGCAGTSNEQQTKALTHQQNSDEAASKGQYGKADEEQRKAQDSHHDAVMKAIDDGQPIPPQTKPGDVPPPLPK